MLEKLFNNNLDIIKFLSPYIIEVFDHVLSLRFNDTIEFYLERGL